jgi:hypothetical protein
MSYFHVQQIKKQIMPAAKMILFMCQQMPQSTLYAEILSEQIGLEPYS